jgi:hypothetical protein
MFRIPPTAFRWFFFVNTLLHRFSFVVFFTTGFPVVFLVCPMPQSQKHGPCARALSLPISSLLPRLPPPLIGAATVLPDSAYCPSPASLAVIDAQNRSLDVLHPQHGLWRAVDGIDVRAV